MNRVAIIVLNWNGIEDTLACLDSLSKQTYNNFRIVIIENGSTDDSVRRLKTYEKKNLGLVDIIYNPRNYGFAGGVNTGIEWALNEDYDYVALFNNDAVADKNWLKNLVSTADSKEKVGITTGLLLHQDGETIDSTGDWMSSWGIAFARNRGDIAKKAPKAGFVFSGSGGASLYKTALFRDIGLFDEDFFAYYEDADLSFRAQLAGWKVYYEPKAVAYHKQGASSNKIPGFTVYQTFKNLPLLFLKNVPLQLFPSMGSRFILTYTLILLNAIVKGSGKYAIKGAWRAFLIGFSKLGERRKILGNKRVSVKYIKSILWYDLPPDQTGMRKFRKIFTGKV